MATWGCTEAVTKCAPKRAAEVAEGRAAKYPKREVLDFELGGHASLHLLHLSFNNLNVLMPFEDPSRTLLGRLKRITSNNTKIKEKIETLNLYCASRLSLEQLAP